MRHVETAPNWALRLAERGSQRRAGNRITRWIKLPVQKARPGARGSVGEGEPLDLSVGANLLAFPSRAAN